MIAKCKHFWSIPKNGFRECLWCRAQKAVAALAVAIVAIFTLSAAVYAETPPVAPVEHAVIETLPTLPTNSPANLFTAVLGPIAKRTDILGTLTFKTSQLFTAPEKSASVSVLYEVWQPTFTRADWQVQFGVGGASTYTPAWNETALGAGASASIFRLPALQAVADRNAITTAVLPRLIAKVFAAVESTVTGKPEVRFVVGGGLPLN